MPSTSLRTEVVMALIDDPDGPKLMVEAMAKTCMLPVQGVSPARFSNNSKALPR